MSKSKSATPKKKRGGKIFAGILLVLLVGALAASMTFNVLQYKQINKPSMPDNNPDDSGVIVTPEPSISLLSMSPDVAVVSSDSSVTTRVTVTPDEPSAQNLALDWSIAFVDPSSTWANGKTVTDYATVTPTSDGALTADIVVLQVFGEQIRVTSTLRSDPTISASCTVDYVKKYSLTGWVGEEQDNPIYNRQFKMTPQLTTSIGTVDDTVTQTITFKAADGWLNFYASHLKQGLTNLLNIDFEQAFSYMRNNVITGTSSITVDYIWLFYEDENTFAASYADASEFEMLTYRLFGIYLTGFNPQMPWENYCSSLSALDNSKKNGINNLFNNAVKQYGKYWADTMYQIENAFSLTYTLKGAHNSISKTYSLPFIFCLLPNYVGSLTIDPPSITV